MFNILILEVHKYVNIPVSYTHLDVYKRQELYCVESLSVCLLPAA